MTNLKRIALFLLVVLVAFAAAAIGKHTRANDPWYDVDVYSDQGAKVWSHADMRWVRGGSDGWVVVEYRGGRQVFISGKFMLHQRAAAP